MDTLSLFKVNENTKGEYYTNGNEAIDIKLVRNPEDIRSEELSFKPAMCHQIFGQSEQIFGYKGLKIKLYYAAGNLTTYVGTDYDEKLDDTHGVEPDNVLGILSGTIQYPFETNLSNFEKVLEDDNAFRPHGSLIHAFKVKVPDCEDELSYEVYNCDTSDPKFVEYHKKIQTFVILYIDAANYINVDEGNWKFFLLYEKYLSGNKDIKYAFAGYSSVYEYYAYPSHIRPRVSQVVILPPFRCRGLCTELVNSVINFYIPNKNVLDITVESPSQDFQRVKDFIDCTNCKSLEPFAAQNIIKGFSKDMILQAREHFKINKRQVRRIYEILRLAHTNIHNDAEYNAYTMEIKDRLNRPNQNRARKRRFVALFESDQEDVYIPAVPASDLHEQSENDLDAVLAALRVEYDKVINRLNRT